MKYGSLIAFFAIRGCLLFISRQTALLHYAETQFLASNILSQPPSLLIIDYYLASSAGTDQDANCDVTYRFPMQNKLKHRQLGQTPLDSQWAAGLRHLPPSRPKQKQIRLSTHQPLKATTTITHDTTEPTEPNRENEISATKAAHWSSSFQALFKFNVCFIDHIYKFKHSVCQCTSWIKLFYRLKLKAKIKIFYKCLFIFQCQPHPLHHIKGVVTYSGFLWNRGWSSS